MKKIVLMLLAAMAITATILAQTYTVQSVNGIRRRWLPVEITVPGEGFTRAWRIGAQQWHSNQDNAAELIPIREAWQVYPPVTAPSSGDRLPQMPARQEILRALQNELIQINR